MKRQNQKPDSCIAGRSKSEYGIHEVPSHRRALTSSSFKRVLISPRKKLSTSGLLRYCQRTISNKLHNHQSLASLIDDLKRNGWLRNLNGEYTNPIQLVKMEDGTLITIDHRRVYAACLSYSRCFAEIIPHDTPVPADQYRRFKLCKLPSGRKLTYGDAVRSRTGLGKEPTTELPKVRKPLKELSL